MNVNPPPFMRRDATICKEGSRARPRNGVDISITIGANTWALNRASYADHTEDDTPRRISSERVIATY